MYSVYPKDSNRGIVLWGVKSYGLSGVTIRDGDWWIGWVEEVPGVNCQERTREELLDSLKATLAEALNFDRPDNTENPV